MIPAPLAYALTPGEIAAWTALAAVGLLGSAVFSGLETGVYTLNRVRLHLLAHQGRTSARLLQGMIRRPNRLLGTLLIGNNIANFAASMGITALLEAAAFGDWMLVLIPALLLTPLLFVFGEVLPKDFFQNFTDHVTYHFARMLWALQWLLRLTLLLPFVDLFSRAVAWLLHADRDAGWSIHPRRAVTQLIKEGLGYGLLSPYQSDMIDRVLHPTETQVRDAMIPWAEVHVVRVDQPPEAVWAMANRLPHTRFPVLDRTEHVIGVLDVFDVLLRDPDDCPPLKELVRPLPHLDPAMTLQAALVELRSARSPMGLVVDDRGRPAGIVTAKDLVEPITGELEVW